MEDPTVICLEPSAPRPAFEDVAIIVRRTGDAAARPAEPAGKAPSSLVLTFQPQGEAARQVPVRLLPRRTLQVRQSREDGQCRVECAAGALRIFTPGQTFVAFPADLTATPSGDGPPWSSMPPDPIIDGIVTSLQASAAAPDIDPVVTEYLVTTLLAYLAAQYRPKSCARRQLKIGLAPWQLRRAKTALADLAQRPTLADMARLCKVSPGHFSRGFKVAEGKSPSEWLAEYRIARAVDMLRESALPIAEIAVRCGFSDQSHFTRSFTRFKGEPPATWRRSNRPG